LNHRKLSLKKRKAAVHFLFFRVPVVGGAALDHITDIHFLPRQPHGLNDPTQELSCLPDKRPPGLILFPTGPFSHEDQPGARAPFSENEVRPPGMEPAKGAFTQRAPEKVQGIRHGGLGNGGESFRVQIFPGQEGKRRGGEARILLEGHPSLEMVENGLQFVRCIHDISCPRAIRRFQRAINHCLSAKT
jgi:hypothetical protein